MIVYIYFESTCLAYIFLSNNYKFEFGEIFENVLNCCKTLFLFFVYAKNFEQNIAEIVSHVTFYV